MRKKGEHNTRICFVNINGIGVKKKSSKSEDIRMFMRNNDVDVIGLAETNVNWSKITTSNTLWERTKAWFETRKIAVSYNTHDCIGKRRCQQGGTATITQSKVAHRHRDNGFDSTGLGRWSWIRIAGKQGCITRFVTVYCPVKTGKGNTIYTQQLRVLHEDPTSRFWNDLSQLIIQWHSDGEQIVLSGDWNEDVTSPRMKEWLDLVGLKDLIIPQHEDKPPPTYHRGSDTIDAIFGSKSVVTAKSGFLGFGEVPGDHRALWVDIPNTNILGYKMKEIPRHTARRLKLDDPRVVDRYNTLLHNYFKEHNLFSRVKSLDQEFQEQQHWTPNMVKKYDEVDKIREQGMNYAEKKCRKLRMGAVAWSPAIQKKRNTILFWTLLKRRRKGCHVSMRRILRLKKRLGITNESQLSDSEINTKLDESYVQYKKIKKRDLEERLNYQEALAQAKADKEDKDAVKILRQMQQREATKRAYAQIGSSLKAHSGSTTKIQVKTPNGIKEVTQMVQMEKYILRENENKFHQTEGWCPLLNGKLAQDLGLFGEGPRVSDVLNGTYKVPSGTDPVVQRWLDTLKIHEGSDKRWHFATLRDYQDGWKKVKE